MANRSDQVSDITGVVHRWIDGDAASDVLAERAVYDQLRRIASRLLRRERPDHPLQASDLTHEAYLSLRQQRTARWPNRSHFFRIAARLMRRILTDHARRQSALKRGAGERVAPEEIDAVAGTPAGEAGALGRALRRLEALHPRQAKAVHLRFVVGLTVEETAAAMGLSTATIKRECRLGRQWLRNELRSAP